MQNLELYFDLVFIVLLIMMIFYSIRLNKQLKMFRDYRSDFKSVMKQFDQSFGKADSSIKDMQNFATGSHKNLAAQIEAAQSLSDELKFMVDSADRIATRLEKANDKSQEQIAHQEEVSAEVDYYKTTSPASSAARRDAALTMQKKLGKVTSLEQKRQDDGSLRGKSQNERDLLKVLKVKAR